MRKLKLFLFAIENYAIYCHNILIASQSIFKYVDKNNNKQINKQIKLKIVLICQKY